MTVSQAPNAGMTFDLGTIAEELRYGDPYSRHGLTARTLMRLRDLRVVLVALEAGRSISEHRASATVSVQTLVGHVRLQLSDRGVDVPAGQLLVDDSPSHVDVLRALIEADRACRMLVGCW